MAEAPLRRTSLKKISPTLTCHQNATIGFKRAPHPTFREPRMPTQFPRRKATAEMRSKKSNKNTACDLPPFLSHDRIT